MMRLDPISFLLLFLLPIVTSSSSSHISKTCCTNATTDSCRTYCQQQMDSVDDLKEMTHHCPLNLHEAFWNCFNSTRSKEEGDSSSEMKDHFGRQCCSLSPVHRCQTACLKAKLTTAEELAEDCRKSDNIQLFQCLTTIREGDECCGLSSDIQCRKACWNAYSAVATSASGAGINGTLRQATNMACSQTPNVLHCAKKLLKAQPTIITSATLGCCDKGSTFQCREICKSVLKSGDPDAADIVERQCGAVSLTEPLWECFMRKSPPSTVLDKSANAANDIKQRSLISISPQRNNYDAAKLSCCDRGKQCYRLCRTAYTNEFFTESEELDNCLAHPNEAALATCLDNVEEPCQPGCSNLSFCSNFNNRPMELFRNCNPEADAAAQNTFQEWIRQTLVVLPGMTGRQDVKLWGPSTCMTPHWKALACTLQFKPCKRNMEAKTAICWKDCFKLLSNCMTHYNSTLAHELCNRLTPESLIPGRSCVSLDDYLVPQAKTAAVVAPCRYNSCRPEQVCVVNRKNPDGYSCLQGCKFGDRSKMIALPKSWIQLPAVSSQCPTSNCNDVCYCNGKGELQQCHTPTPQPFDSCWVDQSQFEHGTRLQNGCNHCICHFGEIVCTRYRCDNATGNIILSCPLQFNPVCSNSGKRFLNSCVSQWQGTSEVLEPCSDEFSPECYTVIQLVYSQKQIDRLSRSTNKSTVFSASLVEQSLRYLLAYSHCHVSVFHSIDGELLVVVHSSHPMNCASCSAEAEKLVLLFDQRSPQITLNVQLDVIVLAEVLQFVHLHPSDVPSGTVALRRHQVQANTFIIPVLLSMLRFI